MVLRNNTYSTNITTNNTHKIVLSIRGEELILTEQLLVAYYINITYLM